MAKVDDANRRAAILADLHAHGVKSSDDEAAFEFQIERAALALYPGPHGMWPPKYSVWKAP
ncbi:MAG: hypothetical protein WA005_07455 [Candidatus Binataceae bacterium]